MANGQEEKKMNLGPITLFRQDLPDDVSDETLLEAWRALAADATVIMDEPVYKRPNGRKGYAHLTADSRWVLDLFGLALAPAGSNGMRTHCARTHPHLDIPEDRVDELRQLGVRVTLPREVLDVARATARGRGR